MVACGLQLSKTNNCKHEFKWEKDKKENGGAKKSTNMFIKVVILVWTFIIQQQQRERKKKRSILPQGTSTGYLYQQMPPPF